MNAADGRPGPARGAQRGDPAVTDRYRVVPAAYVLLVRPGPVDEVLLQLRHGTGFMDGYWACGAAGHVEAGESVHKAAAREAREELGVHIDVADLEPLTAVHRTERTGRPIDERVDFFFACRRWTGRPSPQEVKAAELRWVGLDRLDDLPGPVVPHERHVLDLLRDGAVPAVTSFGF